MQNPAANSELQERLSPIASEFFLAQTAERQQQLAGMIRSLRLDPSVDGERVLEVDTRSGTWSVLVTDDYTIYFRVEPGVLNVDAIAPTLPAVKQSLQASRPRSEQRQAPSKGKFFGMWKS